MRAYVSEHERYPVYELSTETHFPDWAESFDDYLEYCPGDHPIDIPEELAGRILAAQRQFEELQQELRELHERARANA